MCNSIKRLYFVEYLADTVLIDPKNYLKFMICSVFNRSKGFQDNLLSNYPLILIHKKMPFTFIMHRKLEFFW